MKRSIDLNALVDRCMNNMELVRMVLERFEAQVARELPILESAIRSGEMTRTASIAHGLKGAAGVIGSTSIHEVAERMEHACRSGHMELVAPRFWDLTREIDELRTQLPELRASTFQSHRE